MLSRRSALTLLGGALTAPSIARAQTFPVKPIRMIVAYPAGGPTDAIARFVAQDMGPALGQNVIVENMAGASGAVGTRFVARAEPDGHVITFGNNQTHGNNMFLLKEPGYDAIKDFAPLAGAGAFEHAFVVRKDLPAKNLQEFIALAKSKPGELNYGSTGVGSGSHLSTELFMTRTGIKMQHVPFRGAAPLVQEMIAGRIDIANSTLPSVISQIQGGELRALGIASPQRNAQVSDVPTLREGGVTNADASSWTGFFAPVATPQPVLDRLSREILASLNKPETKERLIKLGFSLQPREPSAFRPFLANEMEVWSDVIKTAGVKAE
ncbi:tripartite tricarboxylate transporter substrate binding protein [Terrarubrum flagellatum]|uniref:Bug family tripartite tricarboxylate transporter substrate binding protein n=1 Tax=Terrirubrum flagellatum TaxID=2895980 RepID=UPI00314530B8